MNPIYISLSFCISVIRDERFLENFSVHTRIPTKNDIKFNIQIVEFNIEIVTIFRQNRYGK